MPRLCPACGEPGVPPSGSVSSDILIIGEFPGEAEMERGRPFCGPTGKVLKAELRRVGIEPNMCRYTNLWLHPPLDGKEWIARNEECRHAGLSIALDEAKGRKAVLLVGSDCAEQFIGLKVTSICGLLVDSAMLSAPIVMAIVNPAIVFQESKGVGEVRLALSKFAEACQKEGLLDE